LDLNNDNQSKEVNGKLLPYFLGCSTAGDGERAGDFYTDFLGILLTMLFPPSKINRKVYKLKRISY
jgi:hypothetical protein